MSSSVMNESASKQYYINVSKLSFEEFHCLSFRDNKNDENNIHANRSSDVPY
jgi:hypothetical protein